jgi:hypothetical protein
VSLGARDEFVRARTDKKHEIEDGGNHRWNELKADGEKDGGSADDAAALKHHC